MIDDIFPHYFFQFSLTFPNGKTETASITRRPMVARTLPRSRLSFAPMNSCYAKFHKSASPASASTYPAPAVAMSLKQLWAPRLCQICQDDFSATCHLAPCLWDMLISKHKLAEMLQQDRCI